HFDRFSFLSEKLDSVRLPHLSASAGALACISRDKHLAARSPGVAQERAGNRSGNGRRLVAPFASSVQPDLSHREFSRGGWNRTRAVGIGALWHACPAPRCFRQGPRLVRFAGTAVLVPDGASLKVSHRRLRDRSYLWSSRL